MLHTIWMILKIILIVSVVLTGLILLLLTGLLLLPFQYKIKAERQDKWQIRATITWLGFLLRCSYRLIDGKQQWKVMVFGIPLAGNQKRKKRKREIIQEGRPQRDTIQRKNTSPDFNAAERLKESPKKTRISLKDRVKKLKYTFEKICAKIKWMWNNTKEWLGFLFSDSVKVSFSAFHSEVFYILKKIRPKKWKGFVEFGTGDPGTTGQCLGIVAVLYGIWGTGLQIIPDFEEKKLKADVTCKGKIPLGAVVKSFWRLYKNKDLRVLKQKWDHLGGKKDGR